MVSDRVHALQFKVTYCEGSVSLATQERRDIENSLLDRIAHCGEAAVRIEAPRSRMARIFRNLLCRKPPGVAGRRAEPRSSALDPLGATMVVGAQPAGEFNE